MLNSFPELLKEVRKRVAMMAKKGRDGGVLASRCCANNVVM